MTPLSNHTAAYSATINQTMRFSFTAILRLKVIKARKHVITIKGNNQGRTTPID